MPLIMILVLIILSAASADTAEGLSLLRKGQIKEGYKHLEDCFHKEKSDKEKGRIAGLLAFGEGISTSQIYYARFALKYHPDLKPEDKVNLEIRIADSFMEFGEFKKAQEIYVKLKKGQPLLSDYINYQLGYYYLNTRDPEKAYEFWISIKESNLKPKALRSIGRYWEMMKFPGNIQELSRDSFFMEGFSSSVDEREKVLTLGDLNNYLSKKSSPSMVALLIEKNPIFISRPCDFVKWYRPEINLPNELVFPYLRGCLENDKNHIKKISEIAQAQSKSKDERLFLISLFREQNLNDQACDVATKGELHHTVLSTCQEKSPEMIHSISQILKFGDKEYLRASRVIRSSTHLSISDQKQMIKIVGEQYFLSQLYDSSQALLQMVQLHEFTQESLVNVIIHQRHDRPFLQQMRDFIKDKVGLEIFDYLSLGKSISANVCQLTSMDQRKIVLESKLSEANISQEDLSCSEELLNSNSDLFQLANERIIESSDKVFVDNNIKVTISIMSSDEVRPIKLPPGDFGVELSLLLKVQNFSLKRVSSSDSLLRELKALKKLRQLITTHKWKSSVVTRKASAHFNHLLDQFYEQNKSSFARLNLDTQVEDYIRKMRFS